MDASWRPMRLRDPRRFPLRPYHRARARTVEPAPGLKPSRLKAREVKIEGSRMRAIRTYGLTGGCWRVRLVRRRRGLPNDELLAIGQIEGVRLRVPSARCTRTLGANGCVGRRLCRPVPLPRDDALGRSFRVPRVLRSRGLWRSLIGSGGLRNFSPPGPGARGRRRGTVSSRRSHCSSLASESVGLRVVGRRAGGCPGGSRTG
jgi:hypothetical protein